MPRAPRMNSANIIFHVINRANARLQIFSTPDDYALFEETLESAKEKVPLRLFAYCIMPNHWHLLVEPEADGDLSQFMHWLTVTHTQRWHAKNNTTGSGHLYQGRYKAFPIESDEYFLQACCYIERNPIRAKLVRSAEQWQWGSVWRRMKGTATQRQLLDTWPVQRPRDYDSWLRRSESEDVLKRIRTSVNKGQPFGSPSWTEKIIRRFGLQSTCRPQGRPRKGT